MVSNEERCEAELGKTQTEEGKTSVLGGVPGFPARHGQAMRLQEKTRQVGFEWDNHRTGLGQGRGGDGELQEAVATGDQVAGKKNSGDLSICLINYARFCSWMPKMRWKRTNKKFIHRFTQMESRPSRRGKDLKSMTLEMDAIWNSIKHQGQ